MNNELIERIDAQLLEIRESQQYLDSVKSGLPNIFETLGVSEELLQDCKAALTHQQEAEPVAYISHTSEGDILGWERQFDAPSHTPLYPTPQPAAQPQVPEGYFLLNRDESNMAIWNAVRNIKFGNRDDDKLIVAELNKLGFFVCRRSAAKEEGK